VATLTPSSIESAVKVRPADLGDPSFKRDHGLKYAYVTGAMANGIASCEIVEEMAKAGMVGFFGAAGLGPQRVEAAIDRLQKSVGDLPHGFNLIHSPNEPDLEEQIAELYLKKGVKLVEASAFLDLTPYIVRYRFGAEGNRVIAKISRVEVAEKFMKPAPEALISELVAQGKLTAAQAERARREPVAQDITVEADSGGHTDNRPLVTLLPTIIALRDRLNAPVRVGAAGGIATPSSAAAAFLMGAAYVVTGSVNQACVESGSSDIVRQMLAEAGQADTAMAPAADMFEMGVKVQILKRGTMFAMRAQKLYDVYRQYESMSAIPAPQKAMLERDLFRAPLEAIWAQTAEFFQVRDPRQLTRANADEKHKMALTFRWYLGQASRWANAGLADRKVDYQVWCGPAMGAFNEWAKGSFLEDAKQRRVAVVARNLLAGAAALTQAHFRRLRGEAVPANFSPLTEAELSAHFD
jgi:trans-AT polyketide synthase/acyltransferase/oxidoreductase domain-containing protein